MPEKPIAARAPGRLSRGIRLIADYEPVTTRDHWVDAVAERVMPPVMLAVLGIGLFILGCLFSAPWFAFAGAVGALFAVVVVVRTWRRSCAEWRKACTRD